MLRDIKRAFAQVKGGGISFTILLTEQFLHWKNYYHLLPIIINMLELYSNNVSFQDQNSMTDTVFVPLRMAPTWRLHTKLYKFG